jgi:hypothetical protein
VTVATPMEGSFAEVVVGRKLTSSRIFLRGNRSVIDITATSVPAT